MTDSEHDLRALLAAQEELLWRLQNTTLQLSVEGAGRHEANLAAADLEALATSLEDADFPLLVALLRQLAGALPTDIRATAERAFRLLEIVGRLARGELGEGGLEAAIQALDRDEARPPGGVDGDRYDDLDHEDLREFCVEAREHIATIESNLLALEAGGDFSAVAEIFRGAHSIKGGAQYLGLDATSTVAHRMEALLDCIRAEHAVPSKDAIAVLLRALDVLASLVDGAEHGQSPDIDVAAHVALIDREIARLRPSVPETDSAGPTRTGDSEPVVQSESESRQPPSAAAAEPPEAPGTGESDPTSDPAIDAGGADAAVAAEAADLSDDELFLREYSEHAESARRLLADMNLLAGDHEARTTATRNLHSLKGLAGLVGLEPLELLASALDTLVIRLSGRHRVPHDVQRAVSAALDALDAVGSHHESAAAPSVDVGEIVARLEAFAERERRMTEWNDGDSRAVPATSIAEGPLAVLYGAVADAVERSDAPAVAAAAGALEEAATLHGCSALAAAAAELARPSSELDDGDRRQLLAHLRDTFVDEKATALPGRVHPPQEAPDFEELVLSVPGIGRKRLEALVSVGVDSVEGLRAAGIAGLTAVRGITLDQAAILLSLCPDAAAAPLKDSTPQNLESLEAAIAADDFDRDLVQIYLETTLSRLLTLGELRGAGDTDGVLRVLADLTAAATYMGYGPYVDAFREAHDVFEADPHAPRADELLTPIRASLGRLASLWDAAAASRDGGEVREETAELESIFADSSASHLARLSHEMSSFVSDPQPASLSAIQHHLSCLRSAATNLAKDDIAAAAQHLQDQVEGLWLSSDHTGREESEMLGAVADLHRLCGLEPGEGELLEMPAASREEPAHEAPEGVPDEELDRLFQQLEGPSEPPSQKPVSPEPEPRAPTPAELGAVVGMAADLEDDVVQSWSESPILAVSEPEVGVAEGGRSSGAAGRAEDLATGEGDDDTQGTGAGVRSLVETQATVRVDTAKIDDLMNMAAELVVNRSSFMVLGTQLDDVISRLIESERISKVEARDLRLIVNRFEEATTDLGRVSNQLQEGVMRIRMMPVRTLFARVPRLVRDLALRGGRRVRVTFEGEDTELDKSVIEQLSDPLVHLIRNAISHGIEAPGERLAANKPAEGRLRIAAHTEGNMVTIEVEDDGRGIDRDAVRRRLVAMGLSTPQEAQRMSERELTAALFRPGFTTMAEASDVSGRGVGLDVVRRNIEGLGGQMDVVSEPGRMCRFSIRIPLTMAITQALLVKVEGEVFSIPVAAVIQAVKVHASEISTIENQEVITVRNTVIPLVRLDDVFTYAYYVETAQPTRAIAPTGEAGSAARTEADSTAGNGNGSGSGSGDGLTHVVVLQGEGREIGIVVESLLGSQDIVIKGLEDDLVDARGIAGASILGDGTVTLILDVAEVQKMSVDTDRFRQHALSATMREFERFLLDHDARGLGRLH